MAIGRRGSGAALPVQPLARQAKREARSIEPRRDLRHGRAGGGSPRRSPRHPTYPPPRGRSDMRRRLQRRLRLPSPRLVRLPGGSQPSAGRRPATRRAPARTRSPLPGRKRAPARPASREIRGRAALRHGARTPAGPDGAAPSKLCVPEGWHRQAGPIRRLRARRRDRATSGGRLRSCARHRRSDRGFAAIVHRLAVPARQGRAAARGRPGRER